MKGKIIYRGIAVAAGTLLMSAAFAGPTGLIVMPIADILGHREVNFQVAVAGNERNVDKGHYWAQSVEFGLYDVMEVGYDNDFLGNTVLNAKFLLYQSKGAGKFLVSGGLQNVGLFDSQPDKYIVGRYDMKSCRLHAGCIYNDRFRGMVGIDAPLPKGWSIAADYVSGPGAYAWTQLTIPLPVAGFSLGLAGGLPIDHENGIKHQISLSYDHKF